VGARTFQVQTAESKVGAACDGQFGHCQTVVGW